MDKKTIFGIILMLLFGFACMRFYSKCTGGKSLIGGDFEPHQDWKNILIGEWEFETDLVFPTFRKEYRGTVEYLPNGTFIRRVHIVCANYTENIRNEYFKAGGTIKGKWSIDKEKFWVEKFKEEDCKIVEGYNPYKTRTNPCKDFKSSSQYGEFTTDTTSHKIHIFNKDNIKIKAKFFADSNKEDNIFSFKKIK